jgi:hypothetical protein
VLGIKSSSRLDYTSGDYIPSYISSYAHNEDDDYCSRSFNVAHANEEQVDAWQVVLCKCGEVLGKGRTDDGKAGSGTMRFAKWSVGLLREDNEGENGE